VAFGPGPHLIWGPNAAGKTSLLEAMVMLAWGRSHRTSADGELIRWGADLARLEGQVGADALEVAIVRAGATGAAGRKRIRVNGLENGPLAWAVCFGSSSSRPEEMLLIAGSPSLRRSVIDELATAPARRHAPIARRRTAGRSSSATGCCGRSGGGRSRDELRFWDTAFSIPAP
jgi:DNA replication and repair protein RecF